MIYGYARVSTAGQARDGNSLEAQTAKLTEAGAEIIYSDKFTGTKLDRPEFTKLLDVVKNGDTVIVTKLDRFARSVQQGAEVIDLLDKKGVTINVLNIGKMDHTAAGRLIRNIFLSFAEFERDMIIERTHEGKEIAKANNPCWREGRKKSVFLSPDIVKKVENGEMSIISACKALGISRQSWYNAMKRY